MNKRVDYMLIFSMLALLVLGVLFVYSSSVNAEGTIDSNEYVRQIIFIVTGMALFVLLQMVPLRALKKYVLHIYFVLLFLLFLTLLIGQVRNNARSWLGLWSFSIQISEFMKLGFILLLARMVENNTQKSNSLWFVQPSALLLALPILLILFQPDMGTALVYIPILLAVLYVSGISGARVFFVIAVGVVSVLTLIILYFLFSTDISTVGNVNILENSWNGIVVYVLVFVGVIILSIIGMRLGFLKKFFRVTLYISSVLCVGTLIAIAISLILKPYQLQRLLIFINPDSDPQNTGWHILQSINAIGSGGFSGLGLFQGIQSKLQYLPMAQTDFIFSVIGEEIGFLGTAGVILLYSLLMWRILIIGLRSGSLFGAVCCAGVFAMFFTHFTVNIGMTMGFMPVTGIPLILLSYGGSSLWTAMLSLGIVHNIYYNQSHSKNDIVSTF